MDNTESLNPLDYLIEQEGIDWKASLESWQSILPDKFTIWLVNRFGDLFMIFEDGSLHHLDIQLGTVTKRGDSKQAFLENLLEGNNAADWLYMNYVQLAESEEMFLQKGECYAFKIPPVLSGEYTVDNLCVSKIEENFTLLSGIHEQIRELPEGSTVNVTLPESE